MRSWQDISKTLYSTDKCVFLNRVYEGKSGAVRRFRHLLEGQQNLEFCTDHKPLTYAFTSKTERSPSVQRQLAFLSEFSTRIRHIGVNSISCGVECSDFKQLAEEQQRSPEIAELAANRSLHVEERKVPGPLPCSRGYQYLFTIVDRYTRYPDAIPIKEPTAVECARALLSWISRFGMCLRIARHKQLQYPGLRTPPKRISRADAQSNEELTDRHITRRHELPDIGCSSAELVFGETFRLPGQFFETRSEEEFHTSLATRLRRAFAQLRPAETSWHQPPSGRPTFVSPFLSSASHAFVRVDGHKTALQPPYKGPYRILERGPKSYVLELDGAQQLEFPAQPAREELHGTSAHRTPPTSRLIPTRAGRIPRPPRRFYGD
uniref:RT_RNaseH domain-containing protein n=1 Tax=Trichuris muris TaxID=70415 RepID=A0A5S6QHN4_TRIMR